MKQRGFTLIKLIIVIVVSGVLACMVAPRFTGIQSDARESTLKEAKAALQSGSNLIFAQAAIAGVQTQAYDNSAAKPFVVTGTGNVGVNFGYPASAGLDSQTLARFTSISAADWDIAAGMAPGSVVITPSGVKADVQCRVIYQQAASGGTPVITIDAEAC